MKKADGTRAEVIMADLALLVVVAALLRLGAGVLPAIDNGPHLQAGENWIYALTRGDFYGFWFPFVPVACAAVKYHLPAWSAAALLLLPVPLAFSAGSLLHSARAGALAAALSAGFSALVIHAGYLPYSLYAEQTMIASALLMLVSALRLEFSSYALRSLVLGLVLAMALYAKGVNAPLIPAVLAYEALREKRAARLRGQWAALAVIFAAVAAWSAVNWICAHRFTILEPERAGCNLCTGAAGVIATMEGDWRGMLGIPAGAGATLWAAKEILLHPLRFLLAIPQRAWYLFFTNPLVPGLPALGLLGGLAAWRFRRAPGLYPLIALTAFILGLHLLMPVDVRYFIPAWFLCCVLAGIFLAGGPARAGGTKDVNASAVFFAASAPLAALWVAGFALLVAHPLRSAGPRNARLLAAGSSSPWLHEMAAAAALRGGDFAAAAESYTTAWRAEPTDRRRADYLRAMFLAGKLTGDELRSNFRDLLDSETGALAGLRYAEEGKKEKAARALSCSLQLCVKFASGMRYVSGGRENALLVKLRAESSAKCLEKLSATVALLEPGRGAALTRRLEKDLPGLLRPDALLAAFEADKGADYICSADGTSCSPNGNWSGPGICRGVLAAQLVYPERPYKGDRRGR